MRITPEALARSPRILDVLAYEFKAVGFTKPVLDAAKLIYLAITSRLFERPVSVVVKGVSSGGKSWLTDSVVNLFPADAVYRLTAMSPLALAYDTEPLEHRMLYISEASGMMSDNAQYLVRSLLSEGHIDYQTVVSDKDGLHPVSIMRPGPTGLLSTTTKLALHPENETRFFSVTVPDTHEAIRASLRAWSKVAAGKQQAQIEPAPWVAMQTDLATEDATKVLIPFAEHIDELTLITGARLRRDYMATLTLVRAHALLHYRHRERDADGYLLANLEDYAAVFDLVDPLIGHAAGTAVKGSVRSTVEAVRVLTTGKDTCSQTQLARYLKLDKAAVSRRVADCKRGGYILDDKLRAGDPAALHLGEPMPDAAASVLPMPDAVEHAVAGS